MVAAAGKLYDLGPIDAASWNQLCFSYDAEVREIVVVIVSTVLYPTFSLFCTPTNVFLRHMHRNTVHLERIHTVQYIHVQNIIFLPDM